MKLSLVDHAQLSSFAPDRLNGLQVREQAKSDHVQRGVPQLEVLSLRCERETSSGVVARFGGWCHDLPPLSHLIAVNDQL